MAMPSPLISFLIPTYNRAGLLQTAITSVLQEFGSEGQTVEIIVIDDGSTDATAELLDKFRSVPAVTSLVFETNRGLATARNEGVKIARGEWIALLDSDNTLLPGSGPRLLEVLHSLPPDVGALWGGSRDSDGKSTVTHTYRGIIRGHDLINNEISGEHFSVVRRTLMLEMPYSTSAGSHACEAVFWAEIAKRTRFYITDQQFQYYDTSGIDRICAADNKIRRAPDFATCFELTASALQSFSPKQSAKARGRAALYWCVSGRWEKSVRLAMRALRTTMTPDGILILAVCLAGPVFARYLVRHR